MASNISHDRELVPSSSSTPARNHSLPTSGPRHDRPPRLSQTRGNIQTAAARTHQTGLGSQIPRSNPRRPRSGLCHPPAPTTATIGGTPSHALSAMGRPLLARNSFLAVPPPQRPWDRASAPLHFAAARASFLAELLRTTKPSAMCRRATPSLRRRTL
jgi:hypothetical protein